MVLADLGHTADFWAYQPDAGRRLIDTFLTTGQVDDSHYGRATIDFTPSATATAAAKWVLGTMIGLAVVMVLSLLWLALRRRGFGRTAGALLRSVWPVVLGLGGWCLAALLVLTALPAVPVTDELLTAVSVGLPVGLGVCLAWVHRGRSTTLGLTASVAGALVGAWLGYLVTTGFPALATTIVAATVGANLALLTIDIVGIQPIRSSQVT